MPFRPVFTLKLIALRGGPEWFTEVASVAHSQGQPLLEPATTQQGTPSSVLDASDTTTHNGMTSETLGTFYDSYSEPDIEFSSSSVNSFSPKRRERTTSNSERPLEAPTAIIKKGTITMSEHSSLHRTRLDGSATSISEHDLPNELPANINVSISKDTASHPPTPSKITGKLQADIISSAVSTGTGEQSSRKCLLKGKSCFFFAFRRLSPCNLDIFLEFSSPHHLNEELTLTIMRCDNSKTLRLTKISLTKWKAVENIDL